jgi:hypothetical protein
LQFWGTNRPSHLPMAKKLLTRSLEILPSNQRREPKLSDYRRKTV